MKAVTEKEFREVVDALGLNPERGAWDSIRHFNLVMELEARWGAKVPISDVERLKTFSDFYFRLPFRPAKVLAVDADNTLWNGIVSEDGPDAVVPYVEFQKGLLALRSKGVMLALLSKNDPASGGESPIERVFARRDVPLSLEDFAFVGVNWDPKPANLLSAAHALNVGRDSFVFVDDNPHERAQMCSHIPEVMVVDDFERWAPSGMSGLAEYLGDTYFSEMGKTEEDRLRAMRPTVMSAPAHDCAQFSKADYLKTLDLRVSPSIAAPSDIPRLAQMAGKTNQFNATTIRRGEDDFRKILCDSDRRVYVFRLSDKFGEMGIVCYLVVDVPNGRITDFVMSCRAMGRTLEFFAYGYACRDLGRGSLAIDFCATAKNAPFAEFMSKLSHGDTETFCVQ